MSAVMMLNYLGDTRGCDASHRSADRIEQGYMQALVDGQKTRDLGGELNTREFAQAVTDRLPPA